MGSLKQCASNIDVEPYTVMVETGTHVGAGVDWALENLPNIKIIHTIEAVKERYDQAVIKYANESRVKLYFGYSNRMIGNIVDNIPKDEKVLYWLDAHFPESEKGFSDWAFTAEDRLPLVEELSIIRNKRNCDVDAILCDDLRVYETGPFHGGNLSSKLKFEDDMRWNKSIGEWITTHNIIRKYESQGYIILQPK